MHLNISKEGELPIKNKQKVAISNIKIKNFFIQNKKNNSVN